MHCQLEDSGAVSTNPPALIPLIGPDGTATEATLEVPVTLLERHPTAPSKKGVFLWSSPESRGQGLTPGVGVSDGMVQNFPGNRCTTWSKKT